MKHVLNLTKECSTYHGKEGLFDIPDSIFKTQHPEKRNASSNHDHDFVGIFLSRIKLFQNEDHTHMF